MKVRFCLCFAILLMSGVLAAPPAYSADMPECSKGTPPNIAENCPDQFAWQVLVKVAQPTSWVVMTPSA